MNFLEMMSGGAPAATFDDRFSPVKELLDRIGGGGGMPQAERAPMPSGALPITPMSDEVPMPRGRPAGMPEMDFSGARRAPQQADVPLPMPRPEMAGGGPDMNAAISDFAPTDVQRAQRGMPSLDEVSGQSRAPRSRQDSGLLSMLIPDPDSRRRFTAALAGGMAGGNPAFAGGAFMNGMGGGLRGAQKSDNTDFDQRVKILDRAMKQRDSEGVAQERGARTRYYDTLATRDPSQRKAWNKPPEQRTGEAERLIQSQRKILRKELGLDSPFNTNPAKQAELEATFNDRMKTYSDDLNRRMGVSGKPGGGKPDEEISMQGDGTRGQPYQPSTSADYDEIPSGTYYIHPSDGKPRLKK